MKIKYFKYDMRSMVYVKYSPGEYFTDFINIDWSSFENETDDDYITIGYDDRVIVGSVRDCKNHYITKINDGNAILLHSNYQGNRARNHIYLSASMLRFDHELYYIPFDQYYKIMEIALYNADMLPKERLRQLYHEQIKMKYQTMKTEDISLDILNYTEDNVKYFWCQNPDNLSEIKFGKFYISYFLKNISINIFRESNYYRSGLADWTYKHGIDARLILFNHLPDTPIITRDEFNALEYGVGYTQNYPYYRLFKRTKNNDNNTDFEALENTDDTISERRIKNRHINGVEQSAYYYDIDNTNQLFNFHIDNYGNIETLVHPILQDKAVSLIDFVRLVGE